MEQINNIVKEINISEESDPKVKLSFGKTLLLNHSNDEALKIFLSITEEEYKDEAIFYIAKAYYYKNELDKAEELYNKIIDTKYEGQVNYELAQIYIQKTKKAKSKKKDAYYVDYLNQKIYEYLNKSIEQKATFKGYLSLTNQLFFDNKYKEALEICHILMAHKEWTCEKTKNYYFIKLKMAEIYYHLNSLEESKEILKELETQEFKNKHQIYRLLGLIYVKEKNLEKAKEMVNLLNDKYEAYDFYYAYAKLCSENQEFDEAINFFNKCKFSYMQYQSSHQLGKVYRRLGQFEEAKKLYTSMLNGNIVDKNIGYLGIANCERMSRNYEKALEVLEYIKEPNIQDKCEMFLEKHKIYNLMGKKEESIQALEEVLKLNHNSYGYFEYAKLKMKNKEYEEAIKIFTKIKETNEAYKDLAIVYIGKINKYLGDYDKAKDCFQSIGETSYDAYFEALGELIECALEEKKISLAENYLLKYKNAKKIKDKERYYYYSGLVATAKGDYNLAISLFEKTTLNEVRDYAVTELAKIYWKKFNDIEKASSYIDELKNSLNAISKAQGYYLYGHMYFELGNYEKAKEYLNYNVINNTVRKDDSLYIIATCEEMKNNPEDALAIYTSLSDENNAISTFKLGNLYLKLEKYEEAKKIYKSLVELNRFNKNDSILKLAIIEYRMKNYDESLAILEKLETTKLEESAKIWKAKIYKNLNRFDDSKNILKTLLITTNRKAALLELALLEYERNSLTAALKFIDFFIAEGNIREKSLGNYYKGKIYQREGLLKNARKCFLDTLNVDNLSNFRFDETEMDLNDINISIDKYLVLLELGSVEENLGNYSEAERYYKMIDCFHYNWKFAIKGLVNIKISEEKYEEAEELIRKLKYRSFYDEALISEGKLLCFKGLYEEARKCFNSVSQANDEEALYLIIKTYLYEGDFAKVKSLFEKLASMSDKSTYYVKLYLKKMAVITKDNNNRALYEKYKNQIPESLLKLIYLNIFENNLYEAFKDSLKLFEIEDYREKAVTLLTYLSKELNLILPKKYYGTSTYIRKQIINYNKNATELHIRYSMNSISTYLNQQNIDLNILIDRINPLLNEKNYVYNKFFDTYVIPFEQVGINEADYLAVQTLPKTKQIINIQPVTTRYKEDSLDGKEDFVLTKSLL